MKKTITIVVMIVLVLFMSLCPRLPSVLAGKDIGTTLRISTGETISLVGQDGKEYQVTVLDISLVPIKVILRTKSANGEEGQIISLEKDQEVVLGAMTIVLKDAYVTVTGALTAEFLIYGLNFAGDYSVLIINSTPVGAEVYINNVKIGYTPLKYLVQKGRYTIVVKHEEYPDYVTDVSITEKNTVKEIYVNFLENKIGSLNINSSPKEADVYLNGTYIGKTPLLNYKISPGQYVLRLYKEGFKSYITQINVSNGSSLEIFANLTPSQGRLIVTSTPTDAAVYIDSEYIGQTPVEISISEGNHTVRLSKHEYKDYTAIVTIEAGKNATINTTLTPLFGFLTITSNILDSEVYIDNQKIGVTPIERYKLSVGNHTIEVRSAGYKVFSQNITVEPAKTLTINATLVPLSTQTTGQYSQQQTSLYAPPTQLYSTATTSSLPYVGTSILGFLVLTLILIRKRRKRPLVPDFPHQLLRKYEPLEFLGEGGFAKVFKVKRKKDKKIIALKVFPTNEQAKKFFTKEVRAWKLLDHPNIVKLYNAFDEPIPHLEIEFIEGYILDGKLIRDLDNYPKPVNEELALRFIEGIAKGLRHAHAKQVYHRDLKPSNILLKSDLTPKITDFGLAKVGSKSTTTTTKALTPLYAAPEQIDEKTYGHTDHRTDIYQLGVILYELLTGKLPYEGSSHVVVLAKITNPEIKPKPPSTYNLTLAKYDRMFEKLLAKQKEQRYQSLDEFLDEFRGLVELLKERKRVKESLKITKETITKTRDELEVRKLNSELLRLLVQNAILSARINDKEEVLNTLYDLMPFAKKHMPELEEAIRQVQLFIQEGAVMPEEFIDALKILLHKIEKENL